MNDEVKRHRGDRGPGRRERSSEALSTAMMLVQASREATDVRAQVEPLLQAWSKLDVSHNATAAMKTSFDKAGRIAHEDAIRTQVKELFYRLIGG